jgi:three-Cys-motif partner protein
MSELFHAAIPDAFIRQVFDTMVQTHWHGFQILTKRASWHDAFFEHLRLTFKLKHFILEPYVKEFTHHLGRARSTVYYVDGFAGPGGYQRTTSEFEPGSPVLIANFAEHLRATNRSFTLKCLNVEANRQRYRRLVDATEVFTDHIVEKNYCAPFTGALADILRRIGHAPAFFFLDPFGTKGIPFKDLLPLFRRTGRTEVFITLHTAGIAKKAGWLASLDDPDLRKRKTALGLTENLAKAFDLSRDELCAWWEECGGRSGDGWTAAFEQRVLQHYRTILRAPQTKFQFTKAFPIYYYGPDAPPGEVAPVCFYLVFGTQHQKGLYAMNDCMVKALGRFYEQEDSPTLVPLFRDARDKPKDLARLQHEIVTQFRERPFTIAQMKQHLMQESTILVNEKGYRDAVLGLKKAGQLEQLNRGAISNERMRFQVRPQSPDASGLPSNGTGPPLSLDLT